MLAQEALVESLRDQYQGLKLKNPSYSLRAYAKRLQLNSGSLSAIMLGKRRLSPQGISTLARRMNLPQRQIMSIEKLLHLETSKTEAPPATRTLLLQADQFELLSDALHFSLLSLIETEDFQPRLDWISKRLGISRSRVENALNRLERRGLLIRKEDQWTLTQEKVITTDGISHSAIRRFHEERTTEAKEKLNTIPTELRDFFAMTMAINVNQLPKAKRLFRKFKNQLEALLENGPKTEVYRMNYQIYPVTHPLPEKKK